jgi:putative redox protein
MTEAQDQLELELGDYKQNASTELKLELELQRDLIFQARTPRGYEIDFDAQVEWGCMPTESLLASIAACLAIDVVSMLRKMRAEISDFKVEARATRNATPPQCLTAVHLMVRVKGKNVSENKMQMAISLSKEKYCSVYHTLRKDLEYLVEFEIIRED